MSDKTPKRSEVEKRFTWATEDLFATDELWFQEFSDIKERSKKISEYKGKLSDGKSLLEFLIMGDEYSKLLMRLANFAMRKSDEDTGNSTYQDMRGRVISFIAEYNAAQSFAIPELIAIPDDTFSDMISKTDGLALYERYLLRIRRMKEHVLSDTEEKLLAAAQEMGTCPEQIAATFRNADLRFPNVKDADGKEIPLTQGTFTTIMESPSVDVRRNTFLTFYNVFSDFRNTLASCLDSQVRQLHFFANARKYNSTLEAALFETEVPEAVYNNLIDTVDAKLPYLHKYMRLRKKLMGLDELHMYDLYAPIVSEANKKISFEQAKETVLDALKPLGEDYIAALNEGFDNRWIDVYENVGKRGGAYSSCGDPHPYVLLNHNDTLDSMFTLAHEMGHALHTYHSIKGQPYIYSDYVIFVAEVASTCNEVLLMKYLLKNTTDKAERAYLINYFLEQFRTTLYRQTMFAEFERDINRASEAGESLTADSLCNRYYELNKKYHGNDVVVDDEIRYEWERIPHFFFNFYVFQYATGFSAAVFLANRILSEGKPAVDDYLKFLSSGCSTDPISLLRIAGVDMASPEPVSNALDLFNDLIDEMDKLMS